MATKTFKYIKIPAGDEPVQELEYTGVVELTQDTFVDSLRQQFSSSGGAANMDVLMNNMSQHAKQDVSKMMDEKMMRMVESASSCNIFPVTVPSKQNEYVGISMYVDDKGIAKGLPLNPKAMKLVSECGYPAQEFRGDVFLSRVHDYEDPKDDDACVWTRVDLTASELNSDAKWVQQSKQVRGNNPHAKMSSMGDIMQNSLQEGGAKAAVPDFNKYAGKCGEHIEWREEGSEEIEVKVNIGKAFTKHDVKAFVVGKKCTIKVGDLVLADKQEIFAAIDNDETTWTLSGGDTLNISLFKEDTSQHWTKLFKDESNFA